MIMFVIQYQSHRAGTDFRRELVACDGSAQGCDEHADTKDKSVEYNNTILFYA